MYDKTRTQYFSWKTWQKEAAWGRQRITDW